MLVNAKDDAQPEPLSVRDAGVAAGVLANARVLDLQVWHFGASSASAASSAPAEPQVLGLVAALGDGELAVYARQGAEWVRVDHGVITKGLRGRAARPRKFAQPAGPLGAAFAGAILPAAAPVM